MPTIEINNLGGPLTQRHNGDINSGMAIYDTSWGYDPYSKPGNLTWLEQPASILTFISSSSTTGIYKMKLREENGVSRVYAVGNRASPVTLYRITPTNTTAPNSDVTSVIGSFNASVLYQAGMEFYGSTEKIFTALDGTISKVNFDGSSGSIIGTGFTSRPMPMTTFLGKVYFGNNRNIGEIDSTEVITNTDKLSPALPADVTVTDLDVSPDGNYLQITASKSNSPIFIGASATTNPPRTPVDSYKFYWNGVDAGVTSFDTYGGTIFFASEVFGEHNYVAGQDAGGGILLDRKNKVAIPGIVNLSAAATYSISETFGMVVPEFDVTDRKYKTAVFHYGSWGDQVQPGLYRLLRQEAAELNDVMFVPSGIVANAFSHAPSALSLVNNVAGVPKLYYSNTEISDNSVNNRQNRLWRFNIMNSGISSVVAGIYETQTQLFSKKVSPKEVRVYTNPLATDNAFEVDLIGSGGSVLSGGSRGFTVGTNVTAGEDFIRYNPATAPTYALGVRITNASVTGVRNWQASKIEIDYEQAGK